MPEQNSTELGVDEYAIVTLAYERLYETFKTGQRIPVTSVKHTVDFLVSEFDIPNASSARIMREMERQELIRRDQKEYVLK